MKYFVHRINTSEALKSVDKSYGVEIDLRSLGGNLVLSHDPFFNYPELLSDWLKFYEHSGLILNVKESGLETQIEEMLSKYNVVDYFFLDQDFPDIQKMFNQKKERFAIRISEYESWSFPAQFTDSRNWFWLDSFTGNWDHLERIEKLKSEGKKLCLVSPELHGRSHDVEILQILENPVYKLNLLDAICTKYPEFWEDLHAKF